jgi:hypothetical protein
MKGYFSLSNDIMEDINSFVSQLAKAKPIDPTANHLIHSVGGQLPQALREIEMSHCQFLLMNHFPILHRNNPE